ARQVPRRHIGSVVYAPDNDWAVWMAADKINDNLVIDTRKLYAAKTAARPRARHPYPARTVLVDLSITVPAELHLYATVAISPDLLARFSNHFRRLRPMSARQGCLAARTVLYRRGQHDKARF